MTLMFREPPVNPEKSLLARGFINSMEKQDRIFVYNEYPKWLKALTGKGPTQQDVRDVMDLVDPQPNWKVYYHHAAIARNS